jgi:hypothetical protein
VWCQRARPFNWRRCNKRRTRVRARRLGCRSREWHVSREGERCSCLTGFPKPTRFRFQLECSVESSRASSPPGREKMGSPTLQPLQESILLLP